MRILSLDGSTKATGWAIFDNNKLKEYGVITASSKDVIDRINKIIIELEEILSKAEIDLIVIEEVRPDLGKLSQTHRVLMWLQAAINFLIHERFSKVKIEYIGASSWRKICGIPQGAGIKREVLKARDIEFVNKTFNIDTKSDDVADAIAIGYAYLKENQKKEEINWE